MRSRKAFTMLEMLVVIGVILLLVTIAVAAYGKIVNAMAAKATETALGNCRSFQAEFEQATPMSMLGVSSGQIDDHFPYLGGQNNFVKNPDSNAPNTPIDGTDVNFAGSVGSGSPTRFPDDANYHLATQGGNAVYKTACVMMYFMRINAVSQQVNKLSNKAFLNNMGGQITLTLPPPVGASSGPVMPAPILLDGWGNPIIFVPRSGLLTQLKMGPVDSLTKQPTYVLKLVRSSGVYPTGATPYVPGSPPVVKSTDQAFWASPGPDGRFDVGDDNVYSFKQ